MVKKEGKYPANARVDVDYRSGKPKIKFAYPKVKGKSPKNQAEAQGASFIQIVLLVALAFVLVWLPQAVIIGGEVSPPQDCSVIPQKYTLNTSTSLDINGHVVTSNRSLSGIFKIAFICDTGNYSVWWSGMKDVVGIENEGFTKSNVPKGGELIIFPNLGAYILYTIFIMWFTVIWLNRRITGILIKFKWYQRWLPKANAEGVFFKRRIKKYKKFKAEDLENNMAIIYRFSNVELDYKTKGDFGKQLERIKIREYINQKINVKTKKVGKKKPDVFKWYAIFYFKQTPKDGELEVIYQ